MMFRKFPLALLILSLVWAARTRRSSLSSSPPARLPPSRLRWAEGHRQEKGADQNIQQRHAAGETYIRTPSGCELTPFPWRITTCSAAWTSADFFDKTYTPKRSRSGMASSRGP